MLTGWQNLLYRVGALLLLAGAATYITGWRLSFYLYTVGACLFASMQMLTAYEGRNLILLRLRRQQLFGAVCLLLTAGAMAMQTFGFGFARRNEWVVCLTIACVLELYTAFRIPTEWKKEQEGRKKARRKG